MACANADRGAVAPPLDGDLLRAVGISVNEYLTLMSLSEAPRSELRMSDLAHATALSASRMTRLVDELAVPRVWW